MFGLFNRKGKAAKNWRSRAWNIDLRETKLTIINSEEPKAHVPPWIYKKISTQKLTTLNPHVFLTSQNQF